MAVQAATIISQVQEVCNDTEGVTYTDADILEWVNDGQVSMSNLRPDLFTEPATMTLSEGIDQDLPETYSRLVRIICNMNGVTVNGPVEMNDLNAFGDWRNDDASATVTDYVYHEETPTKFMVYPKNDGTGSLFVDMVKTPPAVTDLTGTLNIRDSLAPAMLDWILFRLFSRDDENTPNMQRAQMALERFLLHLNLKEAKDIKIIPKIMTYQPRQPNA